MVCFSCLDIGVYLCKSLLLNDKTGVNCMEVWQLACKCKVTHIMVYILLDLVCFFKLLSHSVFVLC